MAFNSSADTSQDLEMVVIQNFFLNWTVGKKFMNSCVSCDERASLFPEVTKATRLNVSRGVSDCGLLIKTMWFDFDRF